MALFIYPQQVGCRPGSNMHSAVSCPSTCSLPFLLFPPLLFTSLQTVVYNLYLFIDGLRSFLFFSCPHYPSLCIPLSLSSALFPSLLSLSLALCHFAQPHGWLSLTESERAVDWKGLFLPLPFPLFFSLARAAQF